MLRVLTEPRNALIKQYRKLFAMEGIELEFAPDAIDLVIDRAMQRGTGARALRSIMENALTDLMFSIPDNKHVEKVIVTRDTLEGISEPIMIDRKEKQAA